MLTKRESLLSPPETLLPPNSSRGALGYWQQLMNDVEILENDPVLYAEFKSKFGFNFGDPADLVSLLQQSPGLLTQKDHPANLYAWFIWLMGQSANTTETIAVTLEQIVMLAQQAPILTKAEFDEILTGAGGLTQATENLAQRYSKLGDSLSEMKELKETSLAALKAQMDKQRNSSNTTIQLDGELKTLSREFEKTCSEISNHDQTVRALAAKVTISAILENMNLAIQSVIKGITDFEQTLTNVANDTSTPPEITPSWLEEKLAISEAISQWKALSVEAKSYLSRSVVLAGGNCI